MYTLFRTARPKTHTLSSGTSPYSPDKGVPPPPPRGLKQHKLELELQILTRKEELAGVSGHTIQPHNPSTDTCGRIQKEPSQEKILASLMSDLTPPSHEEINQLANPTFPVMHHLKASTREHSVFSAKGTLKYDKLDISEVVFAFLEFIAQQLQSQHSDLIQYLRLLMEKAMNYSWSSVKNFMHRSNRNCNIPPPPGQTPGI